MVPYSFVIGVNQLWWRGESKNSLNRRVFFHQKEKNVLIFESNSHSCANSDSWGLENSDTLESLFRLIFWYISRTHVKAPVAYFMYASNTSSRDVTIPIRCWGIGIAIAIAIGISITPRKHYLEKLLIFHKVWSKVFGVVESESMNGFSKFWKFLDSWYFNGGITNYQ